jgi:hypothetical protein
MEITYFYLDKLSILRGIRNDIKKKRFVLDENINNFGFDKMTQLKKVKNIDEIKGYPFVASKKTSKTLKGLKLGLKIVPSELKYNKFEHPSNLEYIALKELTDNIVYKNISPHIAFYIGIQKVSNKSRALKFLNLKQLETDQLIRANSNVLLSEYVEGGSLDNWIHDMHEEDRKISDDEWKSMVFQLVYTLSVIQHYYKMMHNDFHYGNILIDDTITPGGYFVYETMGKKYYIKNNGIIPKIWDFEFGMVYSNKIKDFYPNKFIIGDLEHNRKTHITKDPDDVVKRFEMYSKKKKGIEYENETEEDSKSDRNVPYNYNEVYDLHYFLASLLDLYISQDLFDWIIEIYPNELIPRDDSTCTSDATYTTGATSTSDTTSTADTTNATDTTSDSSSDSSTNDSGSSTSDSSSDSSTSEYEIEYLTDGRMNCGVEKLFDNLPTPTSILDHDFFKSLTIKPADFDISEAIYFKSGI